MSLNHLIADIRDMLISIVSNLILGVINHIPGRPNNSLKNFIQRHLLKMLWIKVGSSLQLSPRFFVFRRGGLYAGNNCRFGYNFSVWNHSPLTIGNDLLASHDVKIICGTHLTDLQRTGVPGPVFIGNNVWIGANVLIVGPCTIGDNVIIGANSYVTGNHCENSIIAGSPARNIKSRTE
ncbi:DapH/DapD/GlmU-related protein [Limnobacter sp.]|uniref:acyltransferase n=1 Tax=Limnobacter sp. TaxID=2003368 RepID=UPI002735F02F|nr:acyltransferase [Limnobacter sp.]MDP3272192.1 acyltransferase [Limnobacter sp.]